MTELDSRNGHNNGSRAERIRHRSLIDAVSSFALMGGSSIVENHRRENPQIGENWRTYFSSAMLFGGLFLMVKSMFGAWKAHELDGEEDVPKSIPAADGRDCGINETKVCLRSLQAKTLLEHAANRGASDRGKA